jgi:hypothetical protein
LPKTFENIDQKATEQLKNRAMLTEKEIETLLNKAELKSLGSLSNAKKCLICFKIVL